MDILPQSRRERALYRTRIRHDLPIQSEWPAFGKGDDLYHDIGREKHDDISPYNKLFVRKVENDTAVEIQQNKFL